VWVVDDAAEVLRASMSDPMVAGMSVRQPPATSAAASAGDSAVADRPVCARRNGHGIAHHPVSSAEMFEGSAADNRSLI